MNVTGIVLPFPLPTSSPSAQAFFWFLLAAYLARVLAKPLDHEIQTTDWFIKQHFIIQWLIKRLLDLFHHWYIGWAICVYPEYLSAFVPFSAEEVYWIGFAILLNDLPELPTRIREAFKDYTFMEWNNEGG